MRQTFASRKWKRRAATVGTATVRAIRAAGFDVIPLPTTALPNHARVIHPTGIAGFTDEPLAELSRAFATTTGC